jgi:Metal-dependent hydrolase
MTKTIFHIINILFCLLLLTIYGVAFISPDTFPTLSLLEFLYPVVLCVNVLFILIWAFVKWRYMIFPLVCIMIRVDYIPTFFNLGGAQHSQVKAQLRDDDFKVLTYNIGSVSYGLNQKAEWRDNRAASDKKIDSLFDYIKELRPAVIAFQEYYSSRKDSHSLHNRLLNVGYSYFYSPLNSKTPYITNSVIYSKYPIVKAGTLLADGEDNINDIIYADIEVQKAHVVRICNFHLASFHLEKREGEVFTKLKEADLSIDEKAKASIIEKLKFANRVRSTEINYVLPELKESYLPTLVLGDFNDTPYSYTYRQMRKSFSDAFVAQGKGFGTTYNGDFPPFRIDYIFYNKDQFQILSYQKDEIKVSDHYPVSCLVRVKKI